MVIYKAEVLRKARTFCHSGHRYFISRNVPVLIEVIIDTLQVIKTISNIQYATSTCQVWLMRTWGYRSKIPGCGGRRASTDKGI